MTLLAVTDLSVDAGDRRLVDGVSFSLGKGERLGIIGESGSGKSLTATALIGLLPRGLRASGSIRIEGVDVVGARDGDLVPLRGTVVSTVFQEPLTALDPLMRIGAQIAEVVARAERRVGRSPTRASVRDGVRALMEQVRLPDPDRIARAFPHEISGGQRQRVAIAMALAPSPRLLVADEPTTALDVTTQAEILAMLDGLVRDRAMALLFISHDLPVVAGIVDRVLVMRAGRVVEEGRSADVFGGATHPYTQDLLDAARRFDRALEGR